METKVYGADVAIDLEIGNETGEARATRLPDGRVMLRVGDEYGLVNLFVSVELARRIGTEMSDSFED